MKASFVSSHAISEAMRYQMMRMQADLVKAEKEVVTGRVADPGLTAGRARRPVDFAVARRRSAGRADSIPTRLVSRGSPPRRRAWCNSPTSPTI
jgi:flagellar hook-associated protein 3 FlgL